MRLQNGKIPRNWNFNYLIFSIDRTFKWRGEVALLLLALEYSDRFAAYSLGWADF
jgi:hypothetical protein